MYWNSSERWQYRRHRGNGWIFALIFVGLILLTHGWILLLPLMALAAFAFFGFFLPKVAWHMHQGNWHRGDWKHQDWSAWADEKHKRHLQHWGSRWNDMHYGEKPKRDGDDIEYV
jgi:hypothetical protein